MKISKEKLLKKTTAHEAEFLEALDLLVDDINANKEINIKNDFSSNEKLFHAGTKFVNDKILSSGGRVFCMTALGETLEIAVNNAYNSIPKIKFDGMFYRSDIGKKGLKND